MHTGHKVRPTDQNPPGLQSELKEEQPESQHIPTEDGGYQIYKAAGKLEGKKALITGGDSGIGRAVAVLFAMEGADAFIVYLKEEEVDAQETKNMVEKHGRQCHLFPTDLKDKGNCKEAVAQALKAMGTINILVNNHAYQMEVKDIQDLSEYAHHKPYRDGRSFAHNVTGSSGNVPSTRTFTPSSFCPSTRFRT